MSFDWENFGVLDRWFQVGSGTRSLREVVAHEGYKSTDLCTEWVTNKTSLQQLDSILANNAGFILKTTDN